VKQKLKNSQKFTLESRGIDQEVIVIGLLHEHLDDLENLN
jgi:hypothetical protein